MAATATATAPAVSKEEIDRMVEERAAQLAAEKLKALAETETETYIIRAPTYYDEKAKKWTGVLSIPTHPRARRDADGNVIEVINYPGGVVKMEASQATTRSWVEAEYLRETWGYSVHKGRLNDPLVQNLIAQEVKAGGRKK
jgi:hypothetical protein